MGYTREIRTYVAHEDLAAYRRVKEVAASNEPGSVVYADAGEEYCGITTKAVDSGESIACWLRNMNGTVEIEATVNSAIAFGTVLYGAADGKVSDASSGSAQFTCEESGTITSGAVIECLPLGTKSTTAATVSVTDTANYFAGSTVEAVLAEIGADATSTVTIPIPLGGIMLEDGTAIGKFADSATGVTPGFNQVSNKEIVLRWNNNSGGTYSKIAFTIPLPQDLDGTSAMSVHTLAMLSGSTDSPDLVHEVYFGAGDTDCAGTDPEMTGGSALTEYTCAITAANVPNPPSVVTVIIAPKDDEAKTDDVLLYAAWLEGVRAIQS